MSDDLISEDDDIEEPIDEEDDSDTDDDLVGSDEVAFASSPKAVASEVLEDFSIASRQKARDELEDQIAAFLARGGKINEVPANVTADPPKKPTPDYGGRPI